jgi:CubicO group peptidase (beta-lactamase class C family)
MIWEDAMRPRMKGSNIRIKRFACKTFSTWMVAAILAVNLLPGSASADNPLLDRESVEHFVDGFFAEHTNRIAGAVVSVVTPAEVLLERGYGNADKENGMQVDPKKTVFQIASVSKLFTSLAVMQFVEAGKFEVGDDVNNLLPGPIDTSGHSVTIDRLLTHTAGLDETIILPTTGWAPAGELAEWNQVAVPPIVRDPGIVKSYSNIGMSLLGYVVQESAGEPFAQYIRKNITEPLDMKYSGFMYTKEMEAMRARVYTAQGEAIQEAFGIPPLDIPAGGFASTGEDMGKFMRAMLNGGELNGRRVIGPDELDAMTALHASYHPRLGGMAYGFNRTYNRGYSVLSHGGDIPGWHSGLWLIPEDRVGIFLAINNEDTALRNDFISAFMNRFFLLQSPVIDESREGSLAEARTLPASYYKGVYIPTRLSESSVARITKLIDDELRLNLTPRGEGMLTVADSWGRGDYLLQPDGLWLSSYNAIAFHEDDDRLYMQLANSPSIDYRRLAWHEDVKLHVGVISLLLALLLASGISGIVSAVRRRTYGTMLLSASSWIHLTFAAGTVILIALNDTTQAWWWVALRLLLALPVVAVLLAACSVGLAAFGKIRLGTGSRRFGWIGILTLMLSFLFASYLHYWNLFGWFGMAGL